MFTRPSKLVVSIGTAIVLAGGATSASHAQVRVYVPPRYPTPVLPTGACCKADGTCISSTVVGCSVVAGTAVFRGNGTTCNPSPCTAVLMTPVQPAGQNFYPVGVSGDGNTVIGTSSNPSSQYAAGVWRASTSWALTTANGYAGTPTGVSYDGSKVIGTARSAYSASGYIWTVGQAGIFLVAQPAQSSVRPRAISPDGAFIVGTCLDSAGVSRAAGWTNNGTAISYLAVPGGSPLPPIAEACTNGRRYAGFSGTTAACTSFRDLVALPDLPGGPNVSVTLDMSNSGDVAVGYGSIAGATHAVRWDAAGIARDLHSTTIGLDNSVAVDCTGDGQTVVGNASTGTNKSAFIWRESSGMIKLRDYLVTRFPGVNLGGIWYNNVTGISDDGRTICGYDDVPQSTYKMGWIVRLSSAPQ